MQALIGAAGNRGIARKLLLPRQMGDWTFSGGLTKPPGMNGTRKTGGATEAPSDRERRLAEALRRNLRRRKDQAKRRKTQAPDGQDKAPEKP